ncbi:MAG: LysR substrate-binding domain-containing protein [Candidatus Competibacterales bacterium]
MARIRLPLQTLPTFEAVARHLSFTTAARELNLTQSAVSRQIKTLEGRLGTRLFERQPAGLALTEGGMRYLEAVQRALDLLEGATLEILAHPHPGRALRIGTLPTFGTRWLVPRLGGFRRQFPEIVIDLVTLQISMGRGRYGVEWDLRELDVAIVFGDPRQGARGDDLPVADRIMREQIAPVCTPNYLANQPINGLEDLKACTLLECHTRHADWGTWATAVGPGDLNTQQTLGFEHYYMAIAAAMAHLGVALVPLFLVEEELATHRLVRPVPQTVASHQGYYLVRSTVRDRDPQVRHFVRWLLEQTRSEVSAPGGG